MKRHCLSLLFVAAVINLTVLGAAQHEATSGATETTEAQTLNTEGAIIVDENTDTSTSKTFAIFDTTMGKFKIELYTKRAPKTCDNFIGLAKGTKEWVDPKTREKVKRPYYNGLIFHRVIPNFMIQGGCPLGTGTGGPGYKFPDEFHKDLKHTVPGMLSMANAGPNTNGSQFFITVAPTPFLDGKHAVFGKVVEGMNFVNAISKTQTVRDRPVKEVKIKTVKIVVQ